MTTINDALRARANAVMTHHQRWTSRATVAAVAGVSDTRLMGILNGFYTPELDEWERIFAALQVDPFGTEVWPQYLITPQNEVPVPSESGSPVPSLCGAKHRHMAMLCARAPGHGGDHIGGGWNWPQGQEMTQTQLLSSVQDNLATVLSQVTALERRMSQVEKHRHTVSGTGTVSGTTSAPTTK